MATDSWALAVDEQEAAVKSVGSLAGLGVSGGRRLQLGDLRVGSARAPLEFAAGQSLSADLFLERRKPAASFLSEWTEKFFPW